MKLSISCSYLIQTGDVLFFMLKMEARKHSAEYPMPTKFQLKNLKKEVMNSTDILDYLIEVSVVHVALVQHKYSVFLWKHNLSWK